MQSAVYKYKPGYTGIFIAAAVVAAWLSLLIYLLHLAVNWRSPFTYLLVLLQTHLFTGLFITAHDAMHGSLSPNKKLNAIVGQFVTFLYAGFSYSKLKRQHMRHHQHVHTANDPDYAPKGFFGWYLRFMLNYMSVLQFIIMAAAFNVLKLRFPQQNILLFWVAPALLSTFQLFYFGTYMPHRGSHSNAYHSRTQKKNHFLAFISCYFFGYHYEHHDMPHLPWWLLYKTK